MFSAGRIPYSGVDAMSMLKILESGTRLEKPDNAACAPEMYATIFHINLNRDHHYWASRSEPHTNHSYEKIALPMYVCMYAGP